MPAHPHHPRRAAVTVTTVGALLGLAAIPSSVAPAAAQTDPAATTPPAPAPVDPNAPPTTAKPAAPTRPPPGRRALSKDPDVLASQGRNPDGVIVATLPALDVVPVTSERYDGAAQQRDADAAELADANHRLATAEAKLTRLEQERLALVDLIARGTERRRKLGITAERLRETLSTVAVRRFMSDSAEDLYPDPHATIEEALDRSHKKTIAAEAERQVEVQSVTVAERIVDTEGSIEDWRRSQRHNEDETASTTRALTKARSDAEIATAAIVGAEAELRSARPMTVVDGSDLPLVALDAYVRAAADLDATRPSCGLTWWALAAVGRSESSHGRSGGGQAGADGTTSVPVFGPPLDGTNGTKLVNDTDKGQLDLDPVLDRAVGVMQFLPGTWRRWSEDQSGDGTSDPQNIYDGALASGKLLCGSASRLDTDEGLRAAYFAYNRSDAYVEKVMGYANGYRALPVPDPNAPAPDPGDATTATTATATSTTVSPPSG